MSSELLLELWLQLPEEVRSRKATAVEIAEFEAEHAPIPECFKDFLMNFGGGPIGGEWICGIDSLPRVFKKCNHEKISGHWNGESGFPIGSDGAGNPITISLDGRVLVEDHNFGGVHVLAPTFSLFLASGLSDAP